MKYFGGSQKGKNWWGRAARETQQQTGNRGTGHFSFFKKYFYVRPPSWKRVGRPFLIIGTALIFALSGMMPTLQEHVRVAKAATFTVCSSSCDFVSILAAVNASSNGDTISIGTGTFYVTSSISLAGKAKIFDGAGAANTTLIASSSASYIFTNTTNAGVATTYTIKEMTINEQSGTAPGILSFNNQTAPVTVNFTDNTVSSFGNTSRGLLLVSSGNTSGITATISGNTITMDGTSDIVFDWDGVGTTSTITVASNTVTNGNRFFDYNNGSGVGSTITFNGNTMSGFGSEGVIISGGTTIDIYSNTVTGSNTNNAIDLYPDSGAVVNVYSNTLTMGNGVSNVGIRVADASNFQANIYRNRVSGSDYGVIVDNNSTNTGVANVFNNVLYDLNSGGINMNSGGAITYNLFNNTIDTSPAGIDMTNAASAGRYNTINNSLSNTGSGGNYAITCGAGQEKTFNNNFYNYTNLQSGCGGSPLGSDGNISVVPGYTNHNGEDYTLSATSTCSASTDNCDSGAASTTIFHAHVSSASATTLVSATDIPNNDQFDGLKVEILSGTGSGQTRDVSDTASSTDTITMTSSWATNPDSTSVFRVYLVITNDYAGNTRPVDTADIGAYEFQKNTAPTPPSTLYASSTSAQSGSTNPSNVSTTAPIFSAIANDPDASENLIYARIQVATTSDFSDGIYWDSQQTAIATTTKGNRISNITFNSFGAAATTTLSLNDGDVTYYWRIKLWDDSGGSTAEGAWSSVSSTASFTLVDVPTTTSAVAATYVSDSSITVTWTDNSSTETGFVIQRSANEGAYSTVSTTDLGITSYPDTSTSANNQYTYRVAAQNAAGTSAYTTSSAVATTPSAATSVTTTYVSDSSITVAWTDNSTYESGFRVQQSANDGSYSTVTTTATSTVSYADTSTSADSKYIYRVFARNSFATSTAATSSAVFTLSNAPTIGTPTVNSTSSISWSWTDNSAYEDSFRLDFTTGSGTDVDDIASTTASQTTTGLSINTQYAVHVHAYRADRGESTASATSSAVYTYAAVPGSAEKVSGTTDSLTVQFSSSTNPSGTEFYVDNITAGSNSGWITATTYKFTGLNAGTDYSIRVKARNGDSTETSYATTVTIATESQGGGGGDGGGGSGAPSVTAGPDVTVLPKDKKRFDKEELGSFYINDGAKWTNKAAVTLGFNVANVTHFAVADNVGMKGGALTPYAPSAKWTLSKEEGPKTLYAQFYDMTKGSKSAIVKASIILDTSPPGSPKILNAPPYEDISDWLQSGATLKGSADPEVKIVLLLQRTDLTDKIRKKVAELRALRKKQRGLVEEKKAVQKKAQEAKKKTETTQAEVDALTKKVQELQNKVKALQGNEAQVLLEKKKLQQDEEAVQKQIEQLEKEQKGLQQEENVGPIIIPIGLKADPLRTVRIAAATKTTHKTASDPAGAWEYAFAPGTFNAQGEYAIAANAEDDGGNQSGSTTTSFVALEGDAPQKTEPPKEEEEVKPVTTTKETVEVKEPEVVLKPVPVKEAPQPEVVLKPVPVKEAPQPVEESTQSSNTKVTPESGEISGVAPEAGTPSGGVAEFFAQPATVIAAQVTDQVAQAVTVVAEQVQVVAVNTAKEVAKGVVQTYQVAKVVADNPVVEKVNETVAAPTVAAVAVANVTTGATTLPSMLMYLRFLFLQPSMLFGRKKKKAWGVVYNGFTKVPLDLALVRLMIKDKNQVLQSRVTDIGGRYYFLAKQGEYLIEIKKPGFGTVSKHLATVEEDGEFKPLYHGDTITIKEESAPVSPCIPVDPDTRKEDAVKTLKKNYWKHVQEAASGVGFGFSVFSFTVSPSWWMGALLGVHIFVFVFFKRLSKHERKAGQFGTIKDKSTGKPLAKVVVRIFDKEYNKLLDTRVTDKDGRYVFLVGQNTYYLIIEAAGYTQYISKPIGMKELGAIVANVDLLPGFKTVAAPSAEAAAALAAGEHKEKEVDVRNPATTRISADGIPQPSVQFLKSMGVESGMLQRGTLGAEVPLAQFTHTTTPSADGSFSGEPPEHASPAAGVVAA